MCLFVIHKSNNYLIRKMKHILKVIASLYILEHTWGIHVSGNKYCTLIHEKGRKTPSSAFQTTLLDFGT
jgi:hypothetical protein